MEDSRPGGAKRRRTETIDPRTVRLTFQDDASRGEYFNDGQHGQLLDGPSRRMKVISNFAAGSSTAPRGEQNPLARMRRTGASAFHDSPGPHHSLSGNMGPSNNTHEATYAGANVDQRGGPQASYTESMHGGPTMNQSSVLGPRAFSASIPVPHSFPAAHSQTSLPSALPQTQVQAGVTHYNPSGPTSARPFAGKLNVYTPTKPEMAGYASNWAAVQSIGRSHMHNFLRQYCGVQAALKKDSKNALAKNIVGWFTTAWQSDPENTQRLSQPQIDWLQSEAFKEPGAKKSLAQQPPPPVQQYQNPQRTAGFAIPEQTASQPSVQTTLAQQSSMLTVRDHQKLMKELEQRLRDEHDQEKAIAKKQTREFLRYRAKYRFVLGIDMDQVELEEAYGSEDVMQLQKMNQIRKKQLQKLRNEHATELKKVQEHLTSQDSLLQQLREDNSEEKSKLEKKVGKLEAELVRVQDPEYMRSELKRLAVLAVLALPEYSQASASALSKSRAEKTLMETLAPVSTNREQEANDQVDLAREIEDGDAERGAAEAESEDENEGGYKGGTVATNTKGSANTKHIWTTDERHTIHLAQSKFELEWDQIAAIYNRIWPVSQTAHRLRDEYNGRNGIGRSKMWSEVIVKDRHTREEKKDRARVRRLIEDAAEALGMDIEARL